MIDGLKHINVGLLAGLQRGLKPDPLITVSEWADDKRMLPPESARPGKFSMSVTPYNKEISDRLSVTDAAQEIIYKKSSQVGASETGNNWVGYCMDVAPASFLYIMPTDAMMKKTSKRSIQRMIETTDVLHKKIGPARRDGTNTITEKYWEGGSLTMIGANSPVGLASTPIRNVYADEVDRYPQNVGGEGSVLVLAKTRQISYGATKKAFITSTPTIKNQSIIDSEFEKTGQRYYHVPCPFCKEMQVLNFTQVRYTSGSFDQVYYECGFCKEPIAERHKPWMLKNGKWIPKYPERENGIMYGYHINALYSPYGMYSWADMAKDYEEAKNDIAKMIAFTNTKLGESYEEAGEKPNWEQLYERAEDYPANKPWASIAFITAGVDVQADRLEVEIVGWMKGKISQSIDYRVIIGDTAKAEVWDELTKIVNETWIRDGDNAIMPLRLMAVDTGYNTEKVYEFTRKHSVSKVIPIKGRDKLQSFVSVPQSVEVAKAGKKIGKIKVWGIGVSLLKSELYGFLKQQIDYETGEIPNGYCHFPKRETAYFRGLTAEEIVQVTNKKGFDEYVWVKKYKRNEPLDCRNYARAAAAVAGMDRWNADRWQREGLAYETAPPEELLPIPKPRPEQKIKKNSFWNR